MKPAGEITSEEWETLPIEKCEEWETLPIETLNSCKLPKFQGADDAWVRRSPPTDSLPPSRRDDSAIEIVAKGNGCPSPSDKATGTTQRRSQK
jgi:hypothetical protein